MNLGRKIAYGFGDLYYTSSKGEIFGPLMVAGPMFLLVQDWEKKIQEEEG